MSRVDDLQADLGWLAEHGGGDQLADANCWRQVKPHLPDLLAVVRAAQVHHTRCCGPTHSTSLAALGEALALFEAGGKEAT